MTQMKKPRTLISETVSSNITNNIDVSPLERLSGEIVHNGRVFLVRCDHVRNDEGQTFVYDVVQHPGAVGVLAVENNAIYLIKQFRYPIRKVIYEIPAGTYDDTNSLECGKRELREETGMTAESWGLIGKFYSAPGYCDELITLYRASGLSQGEQDLDNHEDICVELVSLEQASGMVQDGRIMDAKTIIAIQSEMLRMPW